MTTQMKQGLQTYQTFHASELDQEKLIMMMFKGSAGFLDKALDLLDENPLEAGKYLTKAKNVLMELISSLNIDEGGEIGTLLFSTYQRLHMKLNHAHMADDAVKIREVRDSLAELGETWQQVFKAESKVGVKK